MDIVEEEEEQAEGAEWNGEVSTDQPAATEWSDV